MSFLKQKFYYKLCVMIRGKIFCYMQKDIEFSLGTTLTQDISSPLSHLYVYQSPELALSSELYQGSRSLTHKLLHKTIAKLMCWGDSIEDSNKFAFSKMCVVETVGLPQVQGSLREKRVNNSRDSSRSKWGKVMSPGRNMSPKNVKIWKNAPVLRIYSSVQRKRSPVSLASNRAVVKRPNVNQLLLRMKRETERLDQEVKDIEKWNAMLELEDMESVQSIDQ